MDTITVIMLPDVVAYLHTNTHLSPLPLLLRSCYNPFSSNMYNRPPPITFLGKKRTLEIGDDTITAVWCCNNVSYEKRCNASAQADSLFRT